jgi:hypothetical protein
VTRPTIRGCTWQMKLYSPAAGKVAMKLPLSTRAGWSAKLSGPVLTTLCMTGSPQTNVMEPPAAMSTRDGPNVCGLRVIVAADGNAGAGVGVGGAGVGVGGTGVAVGCGAGVFVGIGCETTVVGVAAGGDVGVALGTTVGVADGSAVAEGSAVDVAPAVGVEVAVAEGAVVFVGAATEGLATASVGVPAGVESLSDEPPHAARASAAANATKTGAIFVFKVYSQWAR